MPVHSYSRCVVSLDDDAAQAQPMSSAAGAIETFFDQLEAEGVEFVSPGSSSFGRASRQQAVAQRCVVEFAATPSLSDETLTFIGAEVLRIITESNGSEPEPETDELHAAPSLSLDADTDPGDAPRANPDVTTRPRPAVPRRAVEVPTRPEGVMAISRHEAPDTTPTEVSAVKRRRDDVPTRPEGVIALRPPRKN
jgi:hypothetical protein